MEQKKHRDRSFLFLLIAVACALIFGFMGLLLPESFRTGALELVMSPLQSIFYRLIGTLAGPMIFLSVVLGIVNVGDAATLGKLGKRMIFAFVGITALLAAIAAGRVRGKIMRLGNLMGREADGEFQMNIGANAFINSLKTYKALGAYPLEELAKPLEMSPIDRVAEAVCLLATTPDDMYVFHPYNRYALDMGAVIAALNARGLNVDAVSRDEFAAHVDALRNDPAHAAELQGILHYAGHLLENRKITPVDNTWTTTVLYRLGFRWKPAEDNYLANFFDMLNGIAAFE